MTVPELSDLPEAWKKAFATALKEQSLSDGQVNQAIDSGYFIRHWGFEGRYWTSVSDRMYGNKQFSSSFDIADFAKYIRSEHRFPSLPPIAKYRVKTRADIREILSDARRQHYLAEGSLSFRGQPIEYKFRRRVPNPVRADTDGYEISVLPGIYRQKAQYYTFTEPVKEQRSFRWFVNKIEPSQLNSYDLDWSYDSMRVEQHYATQTAGIDIAFEIETALFFATNRFKQNDNGVAYYERVNTGEHQGILYCFRFTDPPVKQTQYLIKEFDFFRTYKPERIIRQTCGLPLLGEYERNIAITDLDCIIQLDTDFENDCALTPEFMFPSVKEDTFYAKILELKDQFPQSLYNVVEYEWARQL